MKKVNLVIKREQGFSDLKECDLIIVVIDPSSESFESEKEIMDKAREFDKQILIIYNIFNEKDEKISQKLKKNCPFLSSIRRLC